MMVSSEVEFMQRSHKWLQQFDKAVEAQLKDIRDGTHKLFNKPLVFWWLHKFTSAFFVL